MANARERAREAVDEVIRRTPGGAYPQLLADAASGEWEPFLRRILVVCDNDKIGYIKKIGMIVDICQEALGE